MSHFINAIKLFNNICCSYGMLILILIRINSNIELHSGTGIKVITEVEFRTACLQKKLMDNITFECKIYHGKDYPKHSRYCFLDYLFISGKHRYLSLVCIRRVAHIQHHRQYYMVICLATIHITQHTKECQIERDPLLNYVSAG